MLAFQQRIRTFLPVLGTSVCFPAHTCVTSCVWCVHARPACAPRPCPLAAPLGVSVSPLHVGELACPRERLPPPPSRCRPVSPRACPSRLCLCAARSCVKIRYQIIFTRGAGAPPSDGPALHYPCALLFVGPPHPLCPVPSGTINLLERNVTFAGAPAGETDPCNLRRSPVWP